MFIYHINFHHKSLEYHLTKLIKGLYTFFSKSVIRLLQIHWFSKKKTDVKCKSEFYILQYNYPFITILLFWGCYNGYSFKMCI